MMAQALIEQWHLAVLRVALDVSQSEPMVNAELVSYLEPSPRSLWQRSEPLDGFGLDATPGPPGELRVPLGLRDDIVGTLHNDLGGQTSLWLRLEPPYGFLGAIPWERALLERTSVPLLRVPDRLPPTPDPGRRWRVAVGVSAHSGTSWSGPYVAGFVHAMRIWVKDCEIDVFADAGTVGQLRAEGLESSDWLHIHEPADARAATRSRSSRMSRTSAQGRAFTSGGTSPFLTSEGRIWADWIATGLAGRAIRALHVVLDADWDYDRPILKLARDPLEPDDASSCSYVGGDEVARLADDLGGATLSLGAPPDVSSDSAMRVLADELGQQRTGSTLYSSIGADSAGDWLAQAHAFLAGAETAMPRHPSLFAYLQPGQVSSSLAREWPEPTGSLAITPVPPPGLPDDDALPGRVLPPGMESTTPAAQTDLEAYYAQAESVPTWVAAAERYVSSQIAHFSQPESTPEAVPTRRAYEEGATEALTEIQALIAKHARPS